MPRRLTLRLLAVPALAALSLAPLALAACGLDLTGQASADDAGPSDATVAPDARDAGGGDGAVADATDEPTDDTGTPPPPDSGKDAGKDCGATQGPAGQANAFPSPGGKVIDGDLGDWGCQAPLVLDKDTAAFVLKPDGGTVAVSAKVRWEYEAGHLFFAAEVTDLLLEADAGDSTLNDSIEMYGSSDAGPLKGTYGANDHHYVWDYKGLVQDWAKSSPVTPPTGVTSKVVITPNGYTVEASILPTAFARAIRITPSSRAY